MNIYLICCMLAETTKKKPFVFTMTLKAANKLQLSQIWHTDSAKNS